MVNAGPNGISRNPHRLHDQRGETLVEFAMGFVLFLMTVFGTIQFGLGVYQYNIISDLAQEGARWAAVRGQRGTIQASATDVQNYVRSRSVGILPAAATQNVFTYSADPSTKACTTTAVDPGTLSAGDGVCVKVMKDFPPLSGIVPISLTLQSTAQMIMAR